MSDPKGPTYEDASNRESPTGDASKRDGPTYEDASNLQRPAGWC
jgi:hypothetical protein